MDVTSVMTRNPATCRAESTVREVARLMLEHDCGEIPVVDQSMRPIGVVTDRDIVVRLVAEGRDVNECKVQEAMSTPPVTVSTDAKLTDVIDVMESRQIRRVPVVDMDGKICGIIAQADIALTGKDRKTGNVVEEVSKPGSRH
ncbi:CBS domain-containing protein [Lysobacter korlensis]|uniref:CBS domain-containing protein n=1 Tax=Lysobacter korlensis TaxID=553636 RepID=A0ABV6RL15_9GAMM